MLLALLHRREKSEPHLQSVLRNLDKEYIRLLLSYIREWNTKPKFCHVAQRVLSELFHILPPKELMEVSGLGELIEGILPYTERHFSRVDRLLRSTFLLDYTLSSMSVLNPLECDTPVFHEPEARGTDTFSDTPHHISSTVSDSKEKVEIDNITENSEAGPNNSEADANIENGKVSARHHRESETAHGRIKKKRSISVSGDAIDNSSMKKKLQKKPRQKKVSS